jgi:hypothetical protein
MMEPPLDIQLLPLVFDRRHANHRWYRAFRELEQREWTRRVICSNWRMDHRVSSPREEQMLEATEFKDERDGETWWQGRYEHFRRTLCRPSLVGPSGLRSAYLESLNSCNAIARGALPAHEQLVHVGSLNRILWRLTSGEHATGDLRLRFLDLTGHLLPERPMRSASREASEFQDQISAIAAAVNRQGLDRVKELARLLCDALGDTQPPWWSGFAQELIPLIEAGDWTGLAAVLGVGHLHGGEWLIVWRYEIRVLYWLGADILLYRPTVIEADDNPYHFPSPPRFPYGITMPLRADHRGACRELIHAPLGGEAAAEACAYPLCRIANPPVGDYNELQTLRQAQCQRLVQEYPQPETEDWLARHGNSL